MARFLKIERKDSLNKGREKLNGAIDGSEQAVGDAASALAKSLSAEQVALLSQAMSQQTQKQLDNIVIGSGTSDAETIQARGDHDLLYQRLDSSDQEMAEKARELENTRLLTLSYTKFGSVWLPPDYVDFIISTLPFNLFRDFTGRIKHDFNFEKQMHGTKIYIRKFDSDNQNDGLSPQNPVITMQRAVEIANSISGVVTFVFMDQFNEAGPTEWAEFENLNKNYNMTSSNENGTFFGSVRTNFNWTSDGALFKADRSSAVDVMDYNYKDVKGVPKYFKEVATIQECRNNYMSWYSDGISVWINYDIEEGINRDLSIIVAANPVFSLDISGKKVFINNIKFVLAGKERGSSNALRLIGNSSSEAYINNAVFKGANLNGLADVGVGRLYVFDSVAVENGVDGFNYHGISSDFIFEYNLYGAFNGTIAQLSANATTAHDGMTILRIGSIGESCYGPLLADVGGCISINIDCRMYNSLLVSGNSKAAFYFSDSGGERKGVSWLINCEGGGEDTFTLYGPSINTNPINIINLKGLKIEKNTKVNFIT